MSLRFSRSVLALALVSALLAACGGDDGAEAPQATGPDGIAAAPPTTTEDTTTALACAREAKGTLAASPAEIELGGRSTVTWSASVPPDCEAQLILDDDPVALTGSITLSPMSTATHRLRLNAGLKTVELAAAKVTVKLPRVVEINGSTQPWKGLLVQALGTPGTTVRLAENVDMDLSSYDNVYISEGVTLTSEREAPPTKSEGIKAPPVGIRPLIPGRTAQKVGPRLYAKSRPVTGSRYASPLFIIRCSNDNTFRGDNVRISGFRLHGPHFETEEGDKNLERGIQVNSCRGVVISNMEIAGWSGLGVYVEDGEGRMPIPDRDKRDSAASVRVEDSFIHHNQHKGGNGYGVDVSAGGFALIQRNVFDFNRHAIAASGKAGTAYRAHQNLVLKGGGVHGKWYNETTHQFDVHGDANCDYLPGEQFEHIWNCGNAGDRFWYTENTFQYTRDNAIKLRGKPRVLAEIVNNVFARRDDNLALRTRENVSIGTNTVGSDTFGRYGVCDFDGDGKDDLFLATGVTWWYSSAGRMHWSFLKAASERIDQVGLGYFDGDQRCDVLAVNGNQWEISSGGTGAWQSLGSYGVPLDQLRFGNFSGVRDHRAGRPNRPTQVFRRAPDGQWSVVTPGKQDWRALQSSSKPLGQLRLGDFTGDGITDVLGVVGGRWSISRSAAEPWQRLNPKLGDDLTDVFVADVNGNGTDDVVRFSPSLNFVLRGPAKAEVSWEGRTEWRPLVPRSNILHAFAGRFDGTPGAELLLVDDSRFGRLFNRSNGSVTPHSLYPY